MTIHVSNSLTHLVFDHFDFQEGLVGMETCIAVDTGRIRQLWAQHCLRTDLDVELVIRYDVCTLLHATMGPHSPLSLLLTFAHPIGTRTPMLGDGATPHVPILICPSLLSWRSPTGRLELCRSCIDGNPLIFIFVAHHGDCIIHCGAPILSR